MSTYFTEFQFEGINDGKNVTLTVPMYQADFSFGAPGDGLTQEQGDARYVKQSVVDQPNGVAGLPEQSLVLLFENALV